MTSNQWNDFQSRGLSVEIDNVIRYFRPENVLGDGNCLFRSLVQSPLFPMSDHVALRTELTDWMMMEVLNESDNGIILKEDYLSHTYAGERNINDHIQLMKKLSVWGTDTEVLAFTLRFGIQIITITNWSGGSKFAIIDSLDPLRRVRKDEQFQDSVTIYLYFHQMGRCMEPKPLEQLNHFCLLHELQHPLVNPFVRPQKQKDQDKVDIIIESENFHSKPLDATPTNVTKKYRQTQLFCDVNKNISIDTKSTKKNEKVRKIY